jgi:hypothetical protein
MRKTSSGFFAAQGSFYIFNVAREQTSLAIPALIYQPHPVLSKHGSHQFQ